MFEVVIIEKMSEGTVADIVQESGNTQEFLDEIGGGTVRNRGLERRVEMTGETACEMHGAEGVLEPAVFRGRIDPPGALELVDLAQPLHPGSVDEVLLRPFGNGRTRRGERDIAVHGIAQQGVPVIEFLSS
jgi:hypothetical protein